MQSRRRRRERHESGISVGTESLYGHLRQLRSIPPTLAVQHGHADLVRSELEATANFTVVNLVNSCFGGSSEPWTKAYPPNSQVCGYTYNKFFISNFFNGSSPNDVAANGVPLNKYFTVPFAPAYGDVNSFNLPLPLQLFFQVQFKM